MQSVKNNSVPKSSSAKGTTAPTSSKGKLRGLSFAEGEKQLAPTVDAKLVAPGAGARLTNANYAKLYDLYGKYLKAGPSKKPGLLAALDQAVTNWLSVHDGSKKHDKARLPAVHLLAQQVRQALSGGSPKVEDKVDAPPSVEAPKDAPPSIPPPSDVPPPPQLDQSPKVEAPQDAPPPLENKVAPPTLPTLLPPEETMAPPQPTTDVKPPSDVPPPPTIVGEKTTEQKPPEEKKEEVKENPVVAKLNDPKVELTTDELATLEYAQLITYLDTRDRTMVEKLRTDDKFIGAAEKLGAEQFANVVCRILLRTPDSVVNKGGSRAEAIRILSSQLRDAEVCKNLLTNEAFVVIIPKNMLMTDFAEFSKWAGTYTFDGRPWDITRGMGGVKSSRNTALAEENLLGEEVDRSVARKGWWTQQWMDHSKSNGNTETNENGKEGPKTGDTGTRVFNAGVYCSGYSTTNHEFFHTIHSLGLNKTDHAKIQSEYDNKKKEPKETEWADGPRMKKDSTVESENYASSTVFEYFAQTGCAFQGTNAGDDSYTSRPRNNGRSWVETNEPGLTTILSKVCSDSELKNVNPRDAKKKEAEAPKPTGSTTATPTTATPTTTTPTTTTPTTTTAPTTVDGGTKVGDSVGLIAKN